MKLTKTLFALACLIVSTCTIFAQDQVKIANGTLEGAMDNGVRSFKGIPFGAPPIDDLRWKPPQPVKNWTGVRKADKFGPRCMQRAIFGDMNFRSNGMSEDCLYLNVWTPAKSGNEKLPVLIYFFGGGFVAGDGSEGRYDGASMAKKGIVAITVNYRLGVFGFFAHPELTNLFNMGNQANGSQQQSLAAAVFAYAAHYADSSALAPVVNRIVHKHVSVGITAEHYPIVGKHLLEFRNTNSLVAKADWDVMLQKTGYTSDAGQCLVMKTVIRERPVLIVLLNSFGKYTRVADARRIRKWMEAGLEPGQLAQIAR